ncbi:RimK family alpha-L-glutamate ligase [Pyrofollis japonicus]|uniref:ATP-grasp domain-containing protein n=1 Tax=Pyrofollis japonicus TaxID=3060460 RepID=UPI00295B1DB8|nr:RimK family alpha-L-glutamate ligase [Pyrofollis japonicus]BEP18163.1 RimK family alpha-L-glutamate ligase [Pyrofollis japonicus]
MPRVAILHYTPRPTWSSRKLLKALSKQGASTLYIVWPYLSAEIRGDCAIKYQGKCTNVDAIIVRGMGQGLSAEKYQFRLALLKAAEDSGILVVNPSFSLFLARDKFSSLRVLESHRIPVPRTIITENPSTALHFVEKVGQAVIKPLMGSLGLGSFRVADIDTAYHVVNLLLRVNQPIYLQEYLEKKDSMDLRVFVVGEKVVGSMYRQTIGGWKTNIARGAKPIPAHPEAEVLEAAVRATKLLGLFYAGVDIIETPNNEFYVIEVNASPLWRGLQSATGVDPAEEIAKLIIGLVKR